MAAVELPAAVLAPRLGRAQPGPALRDDHVPPILQWFTFHEGRHTHATTFDDGVLPTMVMRVMGHEKVTTTLELYARRADDADRVRQALTDVDSDDHPEDGASGVPARIR
ncbi:MAG: hypothetical protein GEV28_23605 [Actinophytocola sp.]|uniref:hypothetical protein n=1 Tax=Actinophytocola sp. TaxID=1872138 RepID=UPI001325377A|nr:hypothetical protein [Actinophytocola sp.]